MKLIKVSFIVLSLLFNADAFSSQSKSKATFTSTARNSNLVVDLKKAAFSTMAALAIGTSVLTTPVVADALDIQQQLQPAVFSSTNVVAEKVVRQGVYQEYEVDINQEYDDARSTFKSAKETKSKKGKYTAILAILVVGSFIVPMAQYFWYVRDDDSSDRFFQAEEIPEPEPPKKKSWFGK